MKPVTSFGVQHPADQPHAVAVHLAQGVGNRLSGGGVMAPVQPDRALRQRIYQRPVAQALHPCGPFGARDRRFGPVAMPQQAQGRDGRPGVVILVRSGQVGQGQVQKPVFVLIDQPPAFGHDMPVLALHK
jgi:hypothetical protein